jgi:hypothetical protein
VTGHHVARHRLRLWTFLRPSTTYAAAYLVVLLSFAAIWFRHSDFLYIGRDADLSLWLGKAYLDWARPFDVTAMNPLQRMTSMLIAINPYINPAVWIFQTDLSRVSKQVFSFIVYFTEVTWSTFVLGQALGFSRPFAFAASLWLAVLLFPPFNFVFGLQGWLATIPPYGHMLTLNNLLLIVFTKVGTDSSANLTAAHRLALNWMRASCIFLLVLLMVLAVPFYSGGMLLGSLLLIGIIFLSSISYQQMLWRLGAGIYVLACCAAFHFPEFFEGAKDYSPRFSGQKLSLLEVHWPVAFSPDEMSHVRKVLCEWGLLCDRLTQWPLALTGSYWLQLSIILGGVALAIRTHPPLARIGALFSALWFILLLIWIAASAGIVAPLPLSPLYFYLMMYPFWAFFSLYAIVTCLETSIGLFVTRTRSASHLWIPFAICLTALTFAALFRASPADLFKQGDPRVRSSSPIVEILEREISLRPGQIYRGSVATLLGSPESVLRQRLLGTAEQPLKPGDFEKFLQQVAIDTGNTHDLLDLWWRDVPTLSEYGQGLSKPLMFYISNVFNSSQDAPDLNFALPRLANLDMLRAMGVRFVITDLKLPAHQASVTRIVPLKDGIDLYLYELPDPNVAGFSPLKLSVRISPAELLQRIRANSVLFESEAFVDSSVTEQLVPVQRSQVIFERGAVHVTASSTGTSALLLPLQFSHCFRLVAEQSDRVKLLRANLIHTLVLFAGNLDVHLKWEFSFWRNSGCRLRDAEDLRALGLH